MNSANHLRANEDYNQALEEALGFHSEPIGLTTETPTSKTDSIIIRQNNTIILLLISLHKRVSNLEKIKDIPESSKKSQLDIDNLIESFGGLKLEKRLNIQKS